MPSPTRAAFACASTARRRRLRFSATPSLLLLTCRATCTRCCLSWSRTACARCTTAGTGAKARRPPSAWWWLRARKTSRSSYLTKAAASRAPACRASGPTCTAPPKARCRTWMWMPPPTPRRPCWRAMATACRSAGCTHATSAATCKSSPGRAMAQSACFLLRCRGAALSASLTRPRPRSAYLHLNRLGNIQEPLP